MAAAGFERHVLRLCGVLAGALLLGVSATPALAQNQPEPGAQTTKDSPHPGERLWNEYPLEPTPAGDAPSRTDAPSRSELPTRAPRPATTSAQNDGFPPGPVTLAFAGVAIALFGVLAFSAFTLTPWPRHVPQTAAALPPRLRTGKSKIAVLLRRRLAPANRRGGGVFGETPRTPSKPTLATSDMEAAFLPQSLQVRSDPMSKQPEEARASVIPDEGEVVGPEPADADTADYTQVGEKVTAVLASAQEAAEQMVASAREEAQRIRSEAQEQAAASTAEAKSEVERMQLEGRRLRVEAEDYRKETQAAADEYTAEARARAEAEAGQRLAEADERAQAIVAEAEQRARFVEREEIRHQEELAAGAKRYEERLTSLLEVFRGMTSQLEDLVPTEPESEDDRKADDAEAEQDAESLEAALRRERETHARSN